MSILLYIIAFILGVFVGRYIVGSKANKIVVSRIEPKTKPPNERIIKGAGYPPTPAPGYNPPPKEKKNPGKPTPTPPKKPTPPSGRIQNW